MDNRSFALPLIRAERSLLSRQSIPCFEEAKTAVLQSLVGLRSAGPTLQNASQCCSSSFSELGIERLNRI